MNYTCETHFTDKNKGKKAIAVCHHCGKPLCQLEKLPKVWGRKSAVKELCGYIIDDPCFFSPTGKSKVEANHCESCLLEHHVEFRSHLQRLKSNI